MFDSSHKQDALNKLMKLEYVFDPAVQKPSPLTASCSVRTATARTAKKISTPMPIPTTARLCSPRGTAG